VLGERGQQRHQYSLTALGRRTLIQKLSEYLESDARSPEGFLTRVGLFQVLEPAVRQHVLDGRAEHLEKRAEHLAGITERFKLDAYAAETTRFLRNQIQAELDWIQRLRKISK
jgi:hypothetical protein